MGHNVSQIEVSNPSPGPGLLLVSVEVEVPQPIVATPRSEVTVADYDLGSERHLSLKGTGHPPC